MAMQALRQFSPPSRQSGAVLLVAIVLLLLAGVMTLFALNAGVFEQRSTGNDMRTKAVNDVAEAGLAQGFEYLMRQHPDMLSNISLWEKCGAADVTFPCGAISADPVDADGDPATPATVARRATMYRLKAVTTNTITGLDIALAKFMLPLASGSKLTTAANGSTVAYGVAPVLCMIKRPLKPDPAPPAAPTPILCGDGIGATATDLRVATFVSVAKIPGESASATLVQTIGQYPKLGDLIDKPPITTAGSAGVTGTLQVVTNPNGGGPGVPVSVWTRVNVQKTGTTNTCYADEFFRYTKNNVTPAPYQGTIRCDQCQCDVNGAPATLSFDNSGNLQDEGIDILDVDAGTDSTTGYHVGSHVGANYNVRSDSLSYPTCEFPPDLFKYVFGTAVWNDTNHDCFGETKLAKVLYMNDGGTSAMVDPDEAWLYKNSDRVIGAPNAALLNPGQAGTNALLSAASTTGIIWCHAGCDIGANVQVGTPAAPVVLILDGPVSIQGTVFGFIFIREPVQSTALAQATLSPTSGSNGSGGCPSNCMLQMNAGAAIYGAVVIQGQMKANGTSAVIYDATVLGNIGGDNNILRATLPGAWNDQRSY
jgi:Tfp pilus assembly protein PilX